MARKTDPDREALLGLLPEVVYEREDETDDDPLVRMDIADALLLLAELRHEREWQLCQSVAKHLLGEIPEPENYDVTGE